MAAFTSIRTYLPSMKSTSEYAVLIWCYNQLMDVYKLIGI